MVKYAILCKPGHNRVYFEQSKQLSEAELSLALMRSGISCGNIFGEHIADIFYITFTADAELDERSLRIVSRLSFVYALFMVKGEMLLPIARNNLRFMEEGISSMLKYSGKTNEIFTAMMINAALFSSDFIYSDRIKLLDPIAGKGTTLFEGLISGFDVSGIEINDKTAAEVHCFFKKYLETEHYKHSGHIEKISGENKSFRAQRYSFSFAHSKEELRSGQERSLEIIAGSSVYANKFYKKNTFDIIVGDLPYGVQHGSITDSRQSSSPTRNPSELLTACLKSWHDVLKRGGAIALAWNTFVLPKAEMSALLERYGFTVMTGGAYEALEHRVDHAIKRDVIVARKDG